MQDYINYLSQSKFYYPGNDLGLTYSKKASTFKVWSPIAKSISLVLYKDAGVYDSEGKVKDHSDYIKEYPMEYNQQGIWSIKIKADLENKYYMYKVELPDGAVNYAVDPYAKAVSANGQRGFILDMEKTNPQGFEPLAKPELIKATDAIIYELNVRDFSISEDSGISKENKGKFLAFTEEGSTNDYGASSGLDHLVDLGVSHVQLLPIYDFATVNELLEDPYNYNWGYDPQNFNAIEGSYASDPRDPYARIRELKLLIKTLHEHDLRVIMDVVYNHTYETKVSAFNKLVPNYYYRTDEDGDITDGSGTGNEVASERPMVRKFIKDSMRFFAEEYGIDGFRMDLMGLIDIQTVSEIVEELQTEVDDKLILLGEPWKASDSALPKANQTLKAKQKNKHFAVFNDIFRHNIKGDVNGAAQGFATDAPFLETAIVRGIESSYRDFTAYPEETINYVTAHDNLILWDKVIRTEGKARQEGFIEIQDGELVALSEERYDSVEAAVAASNLYSEVDPNDPLENLTVRKTILANAIVLTSQGIPFLHAGDEFLRSKCGDDNSYKSPDYINQIRWNNKSIFKDVYKYYRGLIKIRNEHPAFRLETVAKIQEHLEFLEQKDGIVSFLLKNNADFDKWDNIVVIFNPTLDKRTTRLPFAANWKVVANHKNAGTTILDTVDGTAIEVEPVSVTILYDQESPVDLEAARLELKNSELHLDKGETKVVQAELLNKRGLALSKSKLQYEVVDEDIAKVDSRGRIFAKDYGVTELKIKVNSKLEKTVKIIVEKRQPTYIDLQSPTENVYVGQEFVLLAQVLDQNHENLDLAVDFTSSNPDIAEVNNYGLVKFKAGGEVKISANYQNITGSIAFYPN